MTFLDRIAAAIAPAATDEQRKEARRKLEQLAASEPFAQDILEQHREIEALFQKARIATGMGAHEAVEDLSILLSAHSMAEEAVVYPEISDHSGKAHASMAYEEHAMTKVQLAALQKLDPDSKEWHDKLDHIESAVAQHVYQEEGSWLPDVIRYAPVSERQRMNTEYREYFERVELS